MSTGHTLLAAGCTCSLVFDHVLRRPSYRTADATFRLGDGEDSEVLLIIMITMMAMTMIMMMRMRVTMDLCSSGSSDKRLSGQIQLFQAVGRADERVGAG